MKSKHVRERFEDFLVDIIRKGNLEPGDIVCLTPTMPVDAKMRRQIIECLRTASERFVVNMAFVEPGMEISVSSALAGSASVRSDTCEAPAP